MAARIPGFETYTQFHVTPLHSDAQPFEGIAIVTYATEVDREGLATSEIAAHIQRDEQNVFDRALLYNLDEASPTTFGAGERRTMRAVFIVIPAGVNAQAIHALVQDAEPSFVDSYDLTSGKPDEWNNTNTKGAAFETMLHAGWNDQREFERTVTSLSGCGGLVLRIDEFHVMVDAGAPTPVGLRGLDAVRTILELGAENQLTETVAFALFGSIARGHSDRA
jgi:hypothetical protein